MIQDTKLTYVIAYPSFMLCGTLLYPQSPSFVYGGEGGKNKIYIYIYVCIVSNGA